MEHALFLEKPIRGNPRQRATAQAQCVSASRMPSTPSDTASPPSSQHAHSPRAAPESDEILTLANEQLAGDRMTTLSCMTQPQQWHPDVETLATPCSSDQADPEELSTEQSSHHARKHSKGGQRKTTKAACSECRKRKSKVRRWHTSQTCFHVVCSPCSLPLMLFALHALLSSCSLPLMLYASHTRCPSYSFPFMLIALYTLCSSCSSRYLISSCKPPVFLTLILEADLMF